MRYNVTQKSCLKRIQKILFKQTMEKTLRAKIYHFLVNRKPGIRQRYHRFHDGTTGDEEGGFMVLSAGAEFLLLCTVLQIPWRTDRDSGLRGKETAVRRE